jgi:hypothetical protein
MAETQVPYCNAVLRDSHVLNESVNVEPQEVKRARVAVGSDLRVKAETSFENDIKVGHNEEDPGGSAFVVITSRCEVRVSSAVNEATLVRYSAVSEAIFQIVDQFGVVDSGPGLPVETMLPYISQANWVATRRAERALAETGIANMRLRMADVVSEIRKHSEAPQAISEPKPAAPKPAAAASARKK